MEHLADIEGFETFKRIEVSRHYQMQFSLNGQDYLDALFAVFLLNSRDMGCPLEGIYRYVDGKVVCAEHGVFEGNNEGDGNEIPWKIF